VNSPAFAWACIGAGSRLDSGLAPSVVPCRKVRTLRRSSHSDSVVGAPSGAMRFCTVRASTTSSLRRQGPSDFAVRAVGHRFTAHSWGESKGFTRLRRASHPDSTVGAPSGAMLSPGIQHPEPSSRRRPGSSASAVCTVLHRCAAYSWAQSKAFTRLRRASYFSLIGQREVIKRKATPKRWSPGILSCDYAAGLRGFADSTSVCWQRTGRGPSRPPPDRVRGRLCGPFLRPAANAYGARAARILRARAKSEEQRQKQKPKPKPKRPHPPAAPSPAGREKEDQEQKRSATCRLSGIRFVLAAQDAQ
jgi:hypothetical protein